MALNRDTWVAETAATLSEALLGEYTPTECWHLASFLYDQNPDPGSGDPAPEQAILRELLLMQGVQPASADLLSRLLPTLDWDRLIFASSQTKRILGVAKSTLVRRVDEKRIRTVTRPMPEGFHRDFTFWAHDILRILRWRAAHPYVGGQGVQLWPEPTPAKAESPGSGGGGLMDPIRGGELDGTEWPVGEGPQAPNPDCLGTVDRCRCWRVPVAVRGG